MQHDNAESHPQPEGQHDADPLTAFLRQGARELLQTAVAAEVQAVLAQYANITDLAGRQMVVRNGYLRPARF